MSMEEKGQNQMHGQKQSIVGNLGNSALQVVF